MADNQNVMDRRINEFFSEFIDWSKRKEGEDGFFTRLLKQNNCYKIFDACVGDGYDSLSLLQAGFDVSGNDLDPYFRELAIKNCRASGLDLKVTNYDWRQIPDELSGKFDAVICLGNSLTYLFNEKDRQKAVSNFAKLIKIGGIVVIDHRNYDYMLEQREYILQNPSENFRYSGKFYYCNPRFRCFPVVIEDKRVVLNYAKDGNLFQGVQLELYPLRREELTKLMQNAGLAVAVYGDFQEGKFGNDIDFYQQIGRKGIPGSLLGSRNIALFAPHIV